ncbi:peptidoglycan hydrolase-like protein with peptidoglycan-binding domain [Streptacidiphilus sp. MAP12-16]|uniref:peptidoglycan-binding domain-containing protein n=1 Tax=Streptacidiphilus sp. MAP12-16 TaxID=3156300 RepID=UPI0035172E6E
MGIKNNIAKSAAAAAIAATTLVSMTGAANASTNASDIGDGYPNNTHGVWCLQESLNWFQAHSNDKHQYPYAISNLAQDGIWGPQTKQAVTTFQKDLNSGPGGGLALSEDGIVGPQTGNAVVAYGDTGYTFGYCFQYLPTLYN